MTEAQGGALRAAAAIPGSAVPAPRGAAGPARHRAALFRSSKLRSSSAPGSGPMSSTSWPTSSPGPSAGSPDDRHPRPAAPRSSPARPPTVKWWRHEHGGADPGVRALCTPAGPARASGASDAEHRRRALGDRGRTGHRGVLRFGWGGQDHRVCRLRPRGRPSGPTGLRSHHRPGQTPGRCLGRRHPRQHASADRRGLARRAVGAHARPQGHLRRAHRPVCVVTRAGRGDPRQPDLPQPHRGPVGDPGVHGHGEALRALRRRALRPRRRRHPAHRATRSTSSTRPAGSPGSSGTASSSSCSCRPAPISAPCRWRPRRCCARSPKVAGAEIVHDAVAFFQAFEGMEEGFRTRAEHMRRLLARRTTAFVLVTSPRSDTVEEAGWFADKLNESGLAVEGLVVNRVHPAFGRRRSRSPRPRRGARSPRSSTISGATRR